MDPVGGRPSQIQAALATSTEMSGVLANAAANIMGRRRISTISDGKLDHVSDSPDSHPDLHEVVQQDTKGAKWKSNWDLTERLKEKEKKRKEKKKRKKVSQGLLDLVNIGDPAVSGDNTQIKEFVKFDNAGDRPKAEIVLNGHVARYEQAAKRDESEVKIPDLPPGKKMLDTVVPVDVDSLYKSVFENDTFFEIVTGKNYGEIHNYEVSPWSKNEETGLVERIMHYEFPKTIAFSRHNLVVDQVQSKVDWYRPGHVYAVNSVSRNSGVMYSDYFHLEIHTRFTREALPGSTRMVVVVNIIFDKPCLFKSRIESESWSGLKKYYEVVEQEAQLEKTDQLAELVQAKDTKNSLNQMIKSPASERPDKSLGLSRSRLWFHEHTIMAAFLLVILTLLVITLALFKLATAIASLSERLNSLETLLEMHTLKCVNPTFEL